MIWESCVPRRTWLRISQPRLLVWLVIAMGVLIAFAGGYALWTRASAEDGAGTSGLILSSSAPSGDLYSGGEARLTIHLLDLALPMTVEVLVTYSDGSTQYFKRQAPTEDMVIAWTISPGAPTGLARLRLFVVRSCQCGGAYPPPGDAVQWQFQVHSPG